MTLRVFGTDIAVSEQECNCGTGRLYPHEPYCGWDLLCSVSEVCEALLADDATVERMARALAESDGDHCFSGLKEIGSERRGFRAAYLKAARTMLKEAGRK